MAIDFNNLPQEVQDRIELKEVSDSTFYRFRDCIGEDTPLVVNGEYRRAKDLKVGDVVVGLNGEAVRVVEVHREKKRALRVETDSSVVIDVSRMHKMVDAEGKILRAHAVRPKIWLRAGKRLVKKKGTTRDYLRGVVFGAFVADGTAVERKVDRGDNSYTRLVRIVNSDQKFLRVVEQAVRGSFDGWSSTSVCRHGPGLYRLQVNGKEFVKEIISCAGKSQKVLVGSKFIEGDKRVPAEVFETAEGVRGFVDGFCSADCSIGGEEITWSIRSKLVAAGVLDALHVRNIYPSTWRVKRSDTGVEHTCLRIPRARTIQVLKKIQWLKKYAQMSDLITKVLSRDSSKVRRSTAYKVDEAGVRQACVKRVVDIGVIDCVDVVLEGDMLFQSAGGLVTHNCDYTEIFFDTIEQRSDPENHHSMILTAFGSQGSGKSYSALALCKMLDKNFDVEKNVYFDYNRLVRDRAKLRPGMAILMDEQSQSYGLDSHRVMIILAGIKEQLRKRSIHLIFCAPVLYEESKSSMYILETMYIDKEEQECICALKTREGYTLGHVRIPSPLKRFEDGFQLFTKEEIEKYEAHKDEHLDILLGNASVDEYEERAQMVMKHPVFLAAEKIYVQRMGYVPQTMVVQIINKIYPEYNAGVVPYEIAGRIKLDKEISGKWMIAGAGQKKQKDATKHLATRRK